MEKSFFSQRLRMHKRNLLILILLIIGVTSPFIIKNSHYIVSSIVGYVNLDMEEFKKEHRLVDITKNPASPYSKYSDKFTVVPEKLWYDKKMASTWAMYYSYIKNHRYLFTLRPLITHETDLYYKITHELRVQGLNVMENDYNDSQIHIMQFDDFYMFVKVPYGQAFDANASYQGLLTITPWFVGHDMKMVLPSEFKLHNVSNYMLDTTGIDEVCKKEFFIFFGIIAALCLYILFKIMLYHFNPKMHQMYKQMYKLYGTQEEICESIETEYQDKGNITIEKNRIITPSWIIKKGIFSTKIYVNASIKKESLIIKC